MIWALAAAFVIVAVFAFGEMIVIRRLLAERDAVAAANNGEPELPKMSESDRGKAMVDLLCASILEKPEQWSFKQGILKHVKGTQVSLTEDGLSVLIKRGKDVAIVGGEDGSKIREAVVTRNLRASFEDIAKELV